MRVSKFAVGAVALLVPLVAACTSSSDSDGGGTADGTIVIGTLGIPNTMLDVDVAAVKMINDQGGIDGHPVKLIVKNATDAQGPAAVKELIEQDHVVAIVGNTNSSDTIWQSYVSQKGIPIVGGLSVNVPFATNPDFFPTGANIFAMSYGVMEAAKSVGPTNGSLYCAESPQCAQAPAFNKTLGDIVGVKVPVIQKVSVTASDYTAQCQALIDAKVDSYQIAADGPAVVKIAQACYDQGLRATFVGGDAVVRSSFLKVPAMEGSLAAGTTVPFIDDSTPGTKAYQEFIAKYMPDIGDDNGPLPMNSYISMMLFKKAVELGGTDNVTSQSIKAGLYKMKGETLGGLTVPLTYNEGQPTIINCYYQLGIKNGKFTEPNGLKTDCAPDELINTILHSLPAS